MASAVARGIGEHPAMAATVLALAARLVFVVVAPGEGGDWILYRNVAANILSGCGVAVTMPGVDGCVAHFGGNQLPGYPLFAAAVWAVTDRSNVAIMFSQSLAAAASVGWCAHAARRLTGSRLAAGLVGTALALSPLAIAFAGRLLTETLALAAVQWVAAEILLSLADRRVRVLPLAAAITASVWIRLDGILLLPVPAILAWHLAGPAPGRAVRFALPVAAVAALVVGSCLAWSARNVAVGLPPLPRPWVKTDGTYWSPGYTRWVTSWAVGQQERGNALYYDPRDPRHDIGDAAFRDAAERAHVTALLAAIRSSPGASIPAPIDARFAALATHREASLTPRARIDRFWGRLRAVAGRWFWPWRHGVGDGRDWTTPSDAYRFTLLAVAVAALAFSRRYPALGIVAASALAYFVLRATFFAATANTELRYMLEAAPLLEVTAALTAWVVGTGFTGRAARLPSPNRPPPESAGSIAS